MWCVLSTPFLPLPKEYYADMLMERIDAHQPDIWLINTGWTSGPYGTGHRIDLADTRAFVRAVLAGELDKVMYRPHHVFGLRMPVSCPGVDPSILDPSANWSDPLAYDLAAESLAHKFAENRLICQNSEARPLA
ncbi:phosphoenolpyruvate carboxykinase (ATP) [Mucilaginibacter pallidiroseus]|uniref:Phosphoenolpyruvate carboxykinase (ATP) n=1 Tax=Mucilaginibacter pallidiroseus TaxID=2599295 RepID=A0A563U030_9SPHI|nr:phosphoenolpyruvate carboxykinase (ATP) [Mucilaginibacter pallidiroseus]